VEATEKSGVEATSPSRVELTEKKILSTAKDAYRCRGDSKKVLVEPTSAEVSRLTFGTLRDLRVHDQEARNHFAHLLNRGSSLE
jgi:hypothetical protein